MRKKEESAAAKTAEQPDKTAETDADSKGRNREAGAPAQTPDHPEAQAKAQTGNDAQEDVQATLEQRLEVLISCLSNLWGPENLVLKARKFGVVKLLKSNRTADRLLAVERLVMEDLSRDQAPAKDQELELLLSLEDEVADMMAMRTVEMSIEEKVSHKMAKRQKEYINEMRREALKEEGGPETATTRKRLLYLHGLEDKGLAESSLTLMRPRRLEDVVGQERAISSLLGKIGTRYPQHVILYGPPGVGKTTVARLVLEKVRAQAEGEERAVTPFAADAPFVEADAATLRWDPREITNPLLGSVHDPIYQGSKRDFADDGVPEPKLGLVTKAHGGVLFLDEIGELDQMLLNKLLKVLEDKRIVFESSYFDEEDPRVPQYIKEIFTKGAPADFILIGATTRQPHEIPAAIRSRCAEVYFEPLSPVSVAQIVREAAGRIGVSLEEGVDAEISRYALEGRKAVQILTDAYGQACLRVGGAQQPEQVLRADLQAVVSYDRLTPVLQVKASSESHTGRILGLGVSGFLGSCMELEAAVFPLSKAAAKAGRGAVRFNETAGSMTRDSVFNASSVLRTLLDKDLDAYDVHINVVGGGHVDGPSAGVAITLALYSALTGTPVRGDLAVTGEISLHGDVKPVGGIPEKLYGARLAGVKLALIPWENRLDVPPGLEADLKVVPIKSLQEALPLLRPAEAQLGLDL